MEEEMLRDQIVEKTNSTRIRERLLLEVPLTLSKALTIARQIETAVTEAKAMCTESTDGPVHAVQVEGSQQHGKFRKGKSQPPPSFQKVLGKTCYRYGSAQHTANFQGCPAKEALCNACKKKGHFAKVCRGSQQVQEIAVPEVTILNVSVGNACNIMCTVKVSTQGMESQDIDLMLDTGSAVSILPETVYTKLFTTAVLEKPAYRLKDYGGNDISVLVLSQTSTLQNAGLQC
ncbi:uncharacterized protein LOC121711429 [Alosa sapidissima]|uniref:uncharacterized protein LOC121711429 n=1 Tax=Alosa sapidissima TaxID=34773 RepID=UPI001C090902|nr:uncharacterized protein LOC121711429 [Alosa sapidissima]